MLLVGAGRVTRASTAGRGERVGRQPPSEALTEATLG